MTTATRKTSQKDASKPALQWVSVDGTVEILDGRFEMDGVWYAASANTCEILRRIVPAAKETGDKSAIFAMMYFGLKTGSIVEL